MDNAFCEVLNGRVRVEWLNASWFLSMAHGIERIEEWRCSYNNDRSNVSLGKLTPNELARQTHAAQEIVQNSDHKAGHLQAHHALRLKPDHSVGAS